MAGLSGIPGAKFLAGLALWFAQASLSIALAQLPTPERIGMVPSFGAQESQETLWDGVFANVAASAVGIFKTVLADLWVVFALMILLFGALKLLKVFESAEQASLVSRKRHQTGIHRCGAPNFGSEKIRKGKAGEAFVNQLLWALKNTRIKKNRKMP